MKFTTLERVSQFQQISTKVQNENDVVVSINEFPSQLVLIDVFAVEGTHFNDIKIIEFQRLCR